MTRSARIEQRRRAHYQEPAAPSARPDDGGIDLARLGIVHRYLPAVDGTQPYHRSPQCGRVAPISERTIQRHLADALGPGLEDALATPDGHAKLVDDPCEPGGDPFWHELFAGAPRLDGGW